MPLQVLLPCDIVGFLLPVAGQSGNEDFVRRFGHQARKLVNWGLKSVGVGACDYFVFAFAVLFALFEYQNELGCLERLTRFLAKEYLPLHLAAALGVDFDSLFEKRVDCKEK